MKLPSRFLTAAIATFSLVLGGCNGGDSHEKVVDDISVQMDRMVIALSAVTDKDSAEKAVSDMRAIVEEMKGVAARAKALGDPNAVLRAKLDARMKARQEDLQKKMAGLQATLMKAGPEAAGIITKGLMELAPAVDEVSDLFKRPEKSE